MSSYPDLPDVVYLPRCRSIPEQYPGTEEGRAWVETWRRHHLRTQPLTKAIRTRVRSAIKTIYGNASYAPPDHIYFEKGDSSFLERSMLEYSGQFNSGSRSIETLLLKIKQEEEALHNDLFRVPMETLDQLIGRAMGRNCAPSSRELFGEGGADLSAHGIRFDPVVEAVWSAMGLALEAIAEKLEAMLVRGLKTQIWHLPQRPINQASKEQKILMMQLAKQSSLITFGNLCTGSFRSFAFLQKTLSPTVDFSAFDPWLQLVQNTHHVCFGHHFAVVQALPDQIEIDSNGLRRIWHGDGDRWGTCIIGTQWPTG